MNRRDAAKNLYLEGRSILSSYPFAYRAMMGVIERLRPHQGEIRIRPSSDIVIDGFPRSANTFFVSHFEIAQGGKVKIARHLHDAYQITYAEKLGIPAVVLVRDPLDAVSSAMLRDRDMRPGMLLRNYSRFYRQVLDAHDKAVVASFEECIERPNMVIIRLNEIYGTSFKVLDEHSASLVTAEVAAKDRIAMGEGSNDPTRIAAPSDAKRAAKETVISDIRNNHSRGLDDCYLAFGQMMTRREEQIARLSAASQSDYLPRTLLG